MKTETEPEDLKLRMGTKDQRTWEETKKETLVTIEGLEKALLVNKGILDLCNKKIEIEKAKFNSKQ